jgi:hypothetical protein
VSFVQEGGSIYRCDICGKVEPWGPTWTRYSSIAHDETCRKGEIPTACSEPCKAELARRVDAGEIVLPKLRSAGYYMYVSKPGKGYGPYLKPAAKQPHPKDCG